MIAFIITIVAVLIGGLIYTLSRVYELRAQMKIDREAYKQVFQESLDIMSERNIRLVRRMYFLNVCDWAYARRTRGDLLGLAYLLPSDVIENSAPVDVVMYFTDEELEAIHDGLATFRKDRRTAELCKEFKIRS